MNKAFLIGAGVVATRAAFAQQPTIGNPHPMPPEVRARLDKLLARADAKREEGVKLRWEKRYAASEAAFEAAIDILKPAPLFRFYPENELAQTYLAEGLFDLAAKTWQPIYQPNAPDVGVACGLSIAYARTGRVAEGAKIVTNLAERFHQQFLKPDDLPVSKAVNAATVEASALLLWTTFQPDFKHLPEMIDRLDRAKALSPHNASVRFHLAQLRDSLPNPKWKSVEQDYTEAYRYGNEEMRRILKITFAENGARVPDVGYK